MKRSITSPQDVSRSPIGKPNSQRSSSSTRAIENTVPLMERKRGVRERLNYTEVAPAGVKALGGVYGYIMECGLSEALVGLIYLRVSQINNCAYCLDLHMHDLLKKGEKVEKLALVQAWAETDNVFDERERAALAWAETVTRVAESGAPDHAYQAARAVFSEKELVDLTIAIGLMNVYDRIAISFRRPPHAARELNA